MEFSTTDRLGYPQEEVFTTHRDHLPELAEFLPNVSSIETESREESADIVRLVNIWTATRTEVPTIIRPFVKPHMLKWIDRAAWHNAEGVCHWELELGFLKEAIHVSGQNRITAAENGHTDVTIAGDIRVDARKIPGVPKFMAKKVGSTVEKFVIKMITPNLKKTNDGVRRFLEARHRARN